MPHQAKPHPMQNQKNISCFKKKYSGHRLLFQSIILMITSFVFVSCTETVWQNSGDSCIQFSEKPPLRRVINYTDHDLCGRKASPRIAPTPQTRVQTEKD
ncbi:MAG: hypothetical protein CL912_23450 [Deltaproteobacteria bacterium]|nr:hypothetical protein [Deltaproteobacteria bacterium]|tara:strand:- start:176 stop:475 length:300 start_codon:yes stop_codon:yes gene_type:complete